jgi:hypothetical protein
MRHKLVLASLLLSVMIPAAAKADVSIGINLALYPNMVRVPGYPVYYAPEMNSNYFFYDGRYWVYSDDSWYASSWYNGPWETVDSEIVPLYVLRIPVRYYRQPPMYFRGWSAYSPPRWDEHWGNDWSQRHRDWDHWDHRAMPAAAPLPVYQKQYPGNRYPKADQQLQLQKSNYQYQPRRAPAQHTDQSRQLLNASAVAPAVVTPSQSHGNTEARANQNNGQHGRQDTGQYTDQRADQHGNQRNASHPVTQQPATQTPRMSSPAPQPRPPSQRPAPVVNAPIQPSRPQQPEQRPAEHQPAPASRREETQSHDRQRHDEQQSQQQGHREKDHD